MFLYILTAANVAATYAVMNYTVLPYTAIVLLAVTLTDLFFRAPLKYSFAEDCNVSSGRGEGTATPERGRARLRKAVVLQLWLWTTRLWRYTVAFLPAVCLRILSERAYTLTLPYDPEVVSAVTLTFSHIFLILGAALVEFCMFRYMAVWYLLPQCKHTKQAIQWAKDLTLYRAEEVAELCLRTLAFSTARADWVSCQLKRSKHACNFFENANTVSGTLDA